jgi:hypothetical protein
LTSISINYYYWAKAFVQVSDHEIAGLQFSTDGLLLIAHTIFNSWPITTSIIIVINVDSGKVISARNY